MNKLCFKLIFLTVVSFAFSREKLNIKDFEEIKAPSNAGLLLEAQAVGLITSFALPSRIASVSYLFNSGISIKIDPVIGFGSIKGYGSCLGIHIGSSGEYEKGFRYGLRFGLAKVDAIDLDASEGSRDLVDAGYVAEFYGDLLSYHKISDSWLWHWGFSIGRGITSYNDRDDVGKTIKKGGTFRAEAAIGWLIFK